MLCSTKFLVTKKYMEKRGVPGFPAEKFLSRSAEKVHRGTHSCFTPLGIVKFYASED